MKLRAAAVSKCFPATTTANASTSSSASEVEPVQHTPNCTLPGTESNIDNVKSKSCPNLTYLWWNPRDAFTLGSKLPFSSMPCLIYLFWSPIFILKQLPWNLVSSFQVVTDEKLLTFPDHLGPLDLDYPTPFTSSHRHSSTDSWTHPPAPSGRCPCSPLWPTTPQNSAQQ